MTKPKLSAKPSRPLPAPHEANGHSASRQAMTVPATAAEAAEAAGAPTADPSTPQAAPDAGRRLQVGVVLFPFAAACAAFRSTETGQELGQRVFTVLAVNGNEALGKAHRLARVLLPAAQGWQPASIEVCPTTQVLDPDGLSVG